MYKAMTVWYFNSNFIIIPFGKVNHTQDFRLLTDPYVSQIETTVIVTVKLW